MGISNTGAGGAGFADFTGGSGATGSTDLGGIRGAGAGAAGGWANEDAYWRENYGRRPYASADRDYDYYRPAYQYGFESAQRHRGRRWEEVESDLERGWENARGSSRSVWAEIKDAVRDGWNRVTGHGDRDHVGDRDYGYVERNARGENRGEVF